MASKLLLHPQTPLRAAPDNDEPFEQSRQLHGVVMGRQAREEFCARGERMTKRRPVPYSFEYVLRAQPEIDAG